MDFQIGEKYLIRFYDHCIGIREAMECEVMGWVIKDTSKYVVVTHWRVDNKDPDIVDDNQEPVTIVKSCILKKRKIR